MKKLFKSLFVVFVAAVMAIGAGVLSACSGNGIKELTVENPRVSFKLGDDFELGNDFVVWAVSSDGSKTDVTAEAQISKENGFDMNVAGDYQITVRYGGRVASYTIYVNEFDNILKRIVVDSANAKTEYSLGETISYEGLSLTCTYENAQGVLLDETVTSLKDFVVEITDGAGKTYPTGVLSAMGDYTVTVSSGAIKGTYTVTVNKVDTSSVLGAINAAKAFSGEVVKGTEKVRGSLHGGAEYDELDYEYEFGDNYTHVKESLDSPKREYHLGMENGEFIDVILHDGTIASEQTTSDMLNGAPFLLWYSGHTAYGVESALEVLYQHALNATNGDLVVTENESTREYSFSYSGLESRSGSSYRDYYEAEVSFKLGEKYNVESASIRQDYWENNEAFEGGTGYVPSFITNESTGKTTPNKAYSKRIKISVSQETGERTKKNPYSNQGLLATSFKVRFKGEDLGDNGIVEAKISDGILSLNITDIMPESADLKYDSVRLNVTGNHSGEGDSVHSGGLYAYRTNNTIYARFEHGGEWEMTIRTTNVTKTVKFVITGVNPTSMTAQIYNPASGTLYLGNAASVIVGGSISFYGKVNDFTNDAQSATVTSSNSAKATITRDALAGVNCFTFSANTVGEYKVKITSDAASNVSCTFTFTVLPAPDLAELFSGSYSAKDTSGNAYTAVFTAENANDGINGTVVITMAPLDETTGEPINAEKLVQTFTYSVDKKNYEVTMEAVSGDEIGAILGVGALGELVIEDRYNLRFTMVKD